MTIVLTGAGSGGHITPLLAVAHELKKLKPETKIVFIGNSGDSLNDVPEKDPAIDEVYTVSGGKLRRYHGKGLWQLLDLPMLARNIRDGFRVLRGFFQSRRLLKKLKADTVFIKGGILGVPIGLAAASLHIPYLTHDSDALPGLGHRIIGRWAKFHAVALPKEIYAKYYPADKTVSVGVPVTDDYKFVDAKMQQAYKRELGLGQYEKMLFITGGGNGAKKLNEEVAKALPKVLLNHPDLAVVHATGRLHKDQISSIYDTLLKDPGQRDRVIVEDFIHGLYRYSGAADVIIMRAGATNLAEFSIQGKACIIVPNPLLTGGHQLKNAELLAKRDAALIIDDNALTTKLEILGEAIEKLLASKTLRHELGQNFRTFAKPGATQELARLVLKTAG